MKEERTESGRRARPLRTELRADGDQKKLFPNSLRLLISSMRKFWPRPISDDDGQVVEDFLLHFEPVFRVIEDKYHGHKKNSDLKGLVHRLERGDSDISYYHMRAFSELSGIPIGLFCLYSHVVGDSAKGYSKIDLLNFLDSNKAGIDALRDFLNSDENPDSLLRIPSDGADPYTVKLHGLLLARDAFLRTRHKPATQTDDLVG